MSLTNLPLDHMAKKSLARKAFFLFLSISFWLPIDTVAQDSSIFDIFQYRYVGPTRGGRATTVAGVSSQPHVFYMGATGGGVWKTEDYGTTWDNISDGYFATPSIGAISVAQNDPNIIYVGTGSDALRSNVITGKGMYKSIDAGETWQFIGLKHSGHIGAVEIDPTDHNTVFVAAIGQAFEANEERGIFRTTDGGNSWEKVFYLSDTTGFVDIEFMPSNPRIIYATAWRAERKPWTIISGGDENGIYKSVDGGDNWEKTGKGLPELMGKIDLAVSAADSRILYALVEAEGEKGGLYRSQDQGESFEQVSNENHLMHRPFYFCNVDADPTHAEVVYVNGIQYAKSVNGGKDWQRLSAPHGDHHDMWINPTQPDLHIQANDGGANITHNGGKSWSTQFNQPTAELYQVEVDNQYPYWLYAGQQDNYTTVTIPSLPPRSQQSGPVGFILDAGGCETGPAVPNPDNPDIVYANCKGRFSVYNKKTGQEKRYDVGAANMYGHNPKELTYRFQRVSPIHVSPHDSKVIYHTSQFVHKTTDEGKTWETISPDLTAFEPDKQVRSGSPITQDITGEEFYSTIYAIQESKIKQGLIWVGANDGPVHVTQDGGKNWSNVTPKALPKGGRVDCVAPSPHEEGKAFVTILRYQLGDWTPYIFRTKDFGKNWKLINQGIPTDYPVRVVREDPSREGLLYAGTEFGMFISFDDGENWQAFQQNLPITPVTDIKVHRQDLVLSTMGRGFYILDNLSSLHQQLEQVVARGKAQLLQPRNTIRYRYPSFSDTRTGLPSPPYPRPAAMIDYYLPEAVEAGIQLRMLDETGKVIRAFSSEKNSETDSTKQGAERNMATNEVIYTYNEDLINEQGVHRFRWNLRHMGAWDEDENRRFQNGPYAAPGTYTVQLILPTDTLSQPFELLPAPAVLASGVSVEDLKAQEKLALQVVALLSETKMKAADLEKKLEALEEEEADESQTLEALKDKLVQAEGRYTQPKLIAQVSYLLGVLTGADQIPGKDAYQRYEELKTVFEQLGD